jgi:hypothetical protein
MDFDDLYLKIVLEAKRCEMHWFHMSTDDGLGHAMPFLSRNLLYIRRAGRHRHCTRRSSRITEQKKLLSEPNQDKPKKLDLLFTIFHHRTLLYNDALLPNPRRATRKLLEASSRNITPVPNNESRNAAEATYLEQNKRKHNNAVEDYEYEGSSRDSVRDHSILFINIPHCGISCPDTSFSSFHLLFVFQDHCKKDESVLDTKA